MRLKGLEKAWKALVMRAVVALAGGGVRSAVPDWSARPHRVLFLRHDRIGDMIVSTSLIRAIAASHPTIALDVLASPANAPILRAEPLVSKVVLFDRAKPWTWARAARRMRRPRYDAVVDPMVFSPSLTTMLLMLASGARHRIGVGGRSNDAVYTLTVPPNASARHHIEHTAALAAAFGVDIRETDWRPRVPLTPAEQENAERLWRLHETDEPRRGRRLLVNVSAGKAFRQWPDERFVSVIGHARAEAPDLVVLVIGAPDERERTSRIAHASGTVAVTTPSIRDALALVATADLLFTPDTSIGHGASVYEKPAVIMFIRGKDTLWGPYRAPGRIVVSPDKTLLAVPLDAALRALDDLLEMAGVPAERGRPT
jgi:ADP-heptose:LPS heptosyltransferase